MSNSTAPLDEDARLDHIAQEMVDEATAESSPNILSASGFARENISIVHQQRRVTNLAWALSRLRRVQPGDVVGIVGGSFSGLMLATILAMVDDVIVYIFEKEKRLLPRFRDKAHRHLSPILNSRSLGKRFDPEGSAPHFRSPIFAWEAGSATDVRAEWLQEFAEYNEKLSIFTLTNHEVRSDMVHPRPDGVDINFTIFHPDRPCIPVDLLIDATGFGEEANPLDVVDYSYWESGHRLIYDHLPRPAKVLISGCGDSGVIEGLHYAFADFRHEYVTALWRSDSGLEARIDLGLERAHLTSIFANEEPERYGSGVLPEIIWWLDQRHFMVFNAAPWPHETDPLISAIYEQLNILIKPLYEATGVGEPFATVDWTDLEAFVLSIPTSAQFDVRDAVRPLADETISQLIHELAASIDLPQDFDEFTALMRPEVSITLNGLMPTAYTRQLSPYNIWTMRLLLALPRVDYRQGAIEQVVRQDDNRFEASFAGGGREVFDRIVTRYGPGTRGESVIAHRNRRDTLSGDWLLVEVEAIVPDPPNGSQRRIVDPARAAIINGLSELDSRSPGAHTLSKDLVTRIISLGPGKFPSSDPIYDDPIRWLVTELRAGRRPQYGMDRMVRMAMARR